MKCLLSKRYVIDEKYSVAFFLKKGSYAESYRVKDNNRKTKYLKLFDYNKLHRTQIDENGDILEVKILSSLNHPNLVKCQDVGEVFINQQRYGYAVLDFISGETLADKQRREETINPYEAKKIILGVLEGLKYLHQLPVPVIHNEITNLNVMIDLSDDRVVPKIIDFGYARYFNQSTKSFNKEGLSPFYLAPETFNRNFSARSDIFSVGVLYYHLLFGLPPWFFDVSRYKLMNGFDMAEALEQERRKTLKLLTHSTHLDENVLKIIQKALQLSPENRFTTVDEFILALKGELQLANDFPKERSFKATPKKKSNKKQGFQSIAGMETLKELIQHDVIDALNEKERYAEYGLTIPNGMLLYGPPGCGKTFFAEKMAEEIQFNFYQLKPSDIQSKWVNASQENIKKIFDEARQNAPSIIFIDELDAVVPDRNTANMNQMNASLVNEVLAQMNNSSEDGIFVIGATNRPNAIDPAILRPGRLDKVIYVPPPDFEARKSMFELYLHRRPTDLGIDYEKLANETKDYASSDIKFLCDEASRKALRKKAKISMEILVQTIRLHNSSISKDELSIYSEMRKELEGQNNRNDRPRIGFK